MRGSVELATELALTGEADGRLRIGVPLVLTLIQVAIAIGVNVGIGRIEGVEPEVLLPASPHAGAVLILVIHLRAVEPLVSVGIGIDGVSAILVLFEVGKVL